MTQIFNRHPATRFVANIPGVESFAIHSVDLPVTYVVEGSLNFSDLYITYYDFEGLLLLNHLRTFLTTGQFSIEIRLLDAVGAVCENWKFDIEPVAIHPLTVLDYQSKEPILWKLQCKCKNWIV